MRPFSFFFHLVKDRWLSLAVLVSICPLFRVEPIFSVYYFLGPPMQQCTSSIADPISLSDDNHSQIRLLTLVLPAIPVPELLLIAIQVNDGYCIMALSSSSFLCPIFSISPKPPCIFLNHEATQTQVAFWSMLTFFFLLVSRSNCQSGNGCEAR